MSKRCSVACDTPTGVQVCELELPDSASIAVAIAAARLVLGSSVIDWEHAAAGIYGRPYPRDHVFADGDRIELYRPLKADPKAARRARAQRQQLPQAAPAQRTAEPERGPRRI